MTVDQCITKAYSLSKGKATPPASGTAKYNQLLLEADSLTKVWAAEPGIQWNSLYSRVSLGTIGAVNSIALDSTINYLIKSELDPVYAVKSGSRTDIALIQPNQLYIYNGANAVAQAGRTLIFQNTFTTSDALYGATLYAPSILYPTDITVSSQSVQVDDPMWLVFMMAAEFVRNDLVRQNQYGSLVNYAQQSMAKMKENNEGAYEAVASNFRPLGISWE